MRSGIVLGLATLALALLAVGCFKKDAGSCRTDAVQLTEMIAHLDHAPARLKLGTTPLVERADLPALATLDVPVVILHGSVTVRGRDVAATEVGHELDLEGKAGTPEGNGRTYTLAIAPDETWSHVLAILDGARKVGFDHVQLVFAATPAKRPPAPTRTSIDDEIDQLVSPTGAASTATGTMAGLAIRTSLRCPDLAVAFGEAFNAVEPTDEITAHLLAGLVSCDCNVDIPQLRSLLYRLYTSAPPVSMLALVVDETAQSMELAAASPWREASQAFTTAATISPRASR